MRQALGEYDDRADEFELVGDERDDDYAAPERRIPSVLFSLLVVCLFAGGLWFAYHLGARRTATGVADSGGVPLISADHRPDKVRPAQPGGMQIPNQNASIYDEKPGVSPVENLLPPPEKPLPRPEPPLAPPRQEVAVAAPQAPPGPAALPGTPPPPAIAPDRTGASVAAPTEARPAPSAAPIAGKSGAIRVQLASVRTPEEARAEWARLKRDNADLLGHLSAVAVRADLADQGIYYRIEAGPFDDAAAAARLCGALKRRNFGCFVAR
jgi:hypothetical protein